VSFTYPLHSLATPFYEGGIAASPTPPTSIGLGGIQYLIDLEQYRYQGLPAFRDAGAVQSAEPSDQMFDSQGSWWRYRISFHHGAGQEVADLDTEVSDRFRYWQSRGIDPFEKYRACLVKRTYQTLGVAADDIYMVATGTHVYVSDGAALKRSADLAAWVSITGLAGTIVGLTTDGTNVYVATNSGIYVVGAGTGATVFTTAVATTGYNNIAFVANRLLAGDGNRVVEVTSTALSNIYTHFQAAFRWTTIFNVGSRIYVGGYSGNRSELFSATTTDAGALVLAAEAASFFAGELLRNAISYGGSVVLATSEGVRFATLGSEGTLEYGPLIQDAGDTRALAAQGRFAWFGWETFPDSGCGVGRLALDQFTDTLQPAYATDVFTNDVNGDIMAIARFEDRTVFAVSGEGIYVSHPTEYVSEGWLDTGELYFGTVEDKSVTEARARVDPLQPYENVQIQVYDPEKSLLLASGSTNIDNEVGITVNAEGEIANRVTMRITLRGNGSSEPCLRHWRARAYPVAPGTEEWLVPLIIHSRVILGAGEGDVFSYDPWVEVERIKGYWRSKQVVLYQEGDHAFRVRVDNLQIGTAKWRDGGEWFEVTCTVRLLSV